MTWQQIIEEEARRLRDESSILRSMAKMRYSNPANIGVRSSIRFYDEEFLNETDTRNFLRAVYFGYLSEETERKLNAIIEDIPRVGVDQARKDFIAVLDSEMPVWRDRLYITGDSFVFRHPEKRKILLKDGVCISGCTQYGERVTVRVENVNGKTTIVVDDERADGAAMRELRREAKRHHRMTIVCDAGFMGKSADTITCEELT